MRRLGRLALAALACCCPLAALAPEAQAQEVLYTDTAEVLDPFQVCINEAKQNEVTKEYENPEYVWWERCLNEVSRGGADPYDTGRQPIGSSGSCTITFSSRCAEGDAGELGVCNNGKGPNGEDICVLGEIVVGGCSNRVTKVCSGILAMLSRTRACCWPTSSSKS